MKTSSMVPLSSQGGHSAQVNMRLLINGFSVPVAQMGPDFALVDSPVNHPPAAASMVLQVDQAERRWNVYLPSGISAGKTRVEIQTGA
ncbi:MAG: hypothetical protein JWQ04_594 [Pedosphaera sp.]|nr:hypothetical protein [Pedosphaera sp.]